MISSKRFFDKMGLFQKFIELNKINWIQPGRVINLICINFLSEKVVSPIALLCREKPYILVIL